MSEPGRHPGVGAEQDGGSECGCGTTELLTDGVWVGSTPREAMTPGRCFHPPENKPQGRQPGSFGEMQSDFSIPSERWPLGTRVLPEPGPTESRTVKGQDHDGALRHVCREDTLRSEGPEESTEGAGKRVRLEEVVW